MAIRIDSDVGRFKDIIRGKVKNDLKRFATSDGLTAQVGGKIIKVPLSSINIPRFTYGGKGQGGAGMGGGLDIGDPMPGQGKGKGKGGDQAGEGDDEHEFAEFTPDELADMIMEELQLPHLEPKGKGSTSADKAKYNKIGEQGVIKSYKRTYKEALKRSISSGIYSPTNPVIVPIRKDFRYKTSDAQPRPEIAAVALFCIDVSGSMGDEQKKWASKISFWIDTILGKTYKDMERRYIIHDTKAQEVDERLKFFNTSSGGGTQISSAYKLIADIIQKDYPFSDWNTYIYQFSDSDNMSEQDNNLCGQLLRERILPNCNALNFGETKSNGGSGDFSRYLENNFGKDDKVNVAKIAGDDDILPTIRRFFERAQ